MIHTEISLAQLSAYELAELDAELAMMAPDEIGFSLAHSGVFPKNSKKLKAKKRPCSPGLAGRAATLHLEVKEALAVKGFLHTYQSFLEDSIHDLEIDQIREVYREISGTRSDLEVITGRADRLVTVAQSAASGIELHDWSKRVPEETKRALTLIGFASQRDAYAITFRLSHRVARAALAAERPTAYLADLLKRAGLTEIAFVLEFSDSESDENHPLHIHGVAIIPADLLEGLPERLRELLAHDYRQRGDNRAIDIRPLVTPARWMHYITKQVVQTTARLSKGRPGEVSPYYASRVARAAGRGLHSEIRQFATGR